MSCVSQGDRHRGGFSLAAATGLPPALARENSAPLCRGGCDCQWRFREGRLDAGVNIVHCSRLEAATGDKAGLELHASIPLLGRVGPVGVLNLAAPGSERFDPQTLAFLTAVGRQLGTAFARAALLRAREVLGLLAEGLVNKAIAARLGVAEKTVKTHASSVLSKLGWRDRVQAALYARSRRLQPRVPACVTSGGAA